MMTMRNIVIVLLIISSKSNCQETVLVTNKFTDSKQLSERFHVLKSDGKSKHGEYISFFRISDLEFKQVKNGIFKLDDFIKAKGNYENGKKNGNWSEYASHSALKAQGKYLNDKKVGIWLTYKEQGQVEERFDYDKNLKLQPTIHLKTSYPQMAIEKGIEGTVLVSYKISSDCTVSNIQLVEGLSEDCNLVAIESIRKYGELLKKYGVACTDSTWKQGFNFMLH